jgi:hypothetical protein
VKPKRLWSNNGRKRFLTPFSFSPAANTQETAKNGDGISNLRRTGASK